MVLEGFLCILLSLQNGGRCASGEKPEKPRVKIIYLPGDSSSLSNPQQCGSKDLGSVHSSHQSQSTNMQSECNGNLASVHSECISKKRHSSSDLTDLVATSSTPYSSNGSGAHEVGKSSKWLLRIVTTPLWDYGASCNCLDLDIPEFSKWLELSILSKSSLSQHPNSK